MKLPFNEVDSVFKKKMLYIALLACGSIAALYVLYGILPGIRMVGAIALRVGKPLVIGLMICYLLYPAVRGIEGKISRGRTGVRWARPLAVCIVLLITAVLFVGFLAVLVWTAARQIVHINVQTILSFVEEMQQSADGLLQSVQSFLKSQSVDYKMISGILSSGVQTAIAVTANLFSNLAFGVLFAVYFLLDGSNIARYWKGAASAFIRPSVRRKLRTFADEADGCFSGYIRGQVIDAVIVGVVTTIIFLLIDMPYGAIIGLLIGVGNLIPYVGPVLGYGSVILINLMNFNPRMLVTGLIIIAIIMFLDGNILNPKLLAGTIKVHPLLVIVALLAGGSVGGLVGMLLAVPTAALCKIQFDKIVQYKKATTR